MKKNLEKALILLEEYHENGNCDCKSQVYDLNDLEEMLHVSRRTLFKWKSEGKLNFTQIGKKLYVTDSDLREFLVSNKLNNKL